jgi:hypothetical protein
MTQGSQITLAQVADEALLKLVWRKEVRPSLRSMKFKDINLAPDPLHYAGYEWGLQTLVSSLANDIALGRYTPERGEIVRMAKSTGLTRPLCFLATRDALVYSAITWLARDQLLASERSWVGHGRSDKGSADNAEDAGDSFDWFRFWLARQGNVLHMLDDEGIEYIVESDIANFYPSIRLEAVREHLHSETRLEKEVVRLCVQIIDGVMPRRDYSEISLMGLPQEQIGSSREIAHSLLLHVDKEFAKEGEERRYSRYMDDILIGVKTTLIGEKCISRLQLNLESIGLYPNGAKTRVIHKSQYYVDYMVGVNAEIDRLDKELEKHKHGMPFRVEAPDDLLAEIVTLSDQHRTIDAAARPKRWGRVTRRIYTLHRKAGIDSWWKFWASDIVEDPGAAASIFEYIRSWPLNVETATQLAALSREYGGLYENIALLASEVIASAPVVLDPGVWEEIYRVCQNEFHRLAHSPVMTPQVERLAAAWLLSAWKFANSSQRADLLSQVPPAQDALSPLRVQALPLLVANDESLSEWVAAKPGMAWESALAAEYLRSLQQAEERAVGVALSLLDPVPRLLPQRFTMLPRALPLVKILGKANTKKLSSVVPGILKKLESNPDQLRDHRVEFALADWNP